MENFLKWYYERVKAVYYVTLDQYETIYYKYYHNGGI